jgi:hypothetical protein
MGRYFLNYLLLIIHSLMDFNKSRINWEVLASHFDLMLIQVKRNLTR